MIEGRDWRTNVVDECELERVAIYRNNVFVTGRFETDFEFSHVSGKKTFYKTRVKVDRYSDTIDYIPIIVSDYFVDGHNVEGKWCEIEGRFESFNRYEGNKTHLDLFIRVENMNICNEMPNDPKRNEIFLEGFVCKKPVFRETPLGKRITDIMVAVNRVEKKSDYIPCIAWEGTAKWTANLEVGEKVAIYGRIQSRDYLKKPEDPFGEPQQKVAYEISIFDIKNKIK